MNARLWPVFGIFAVAAMWAASAYANYLAGVALADEPKMQYVLGAASVACDILKGVALFIVVTLALKRHWVAASVAVFIFALCTTWSLRSAVYFAASAMDSKISRIEAQNKIADAKLKVIDLKSQRAEFLSGQSVEVDVNNKYARKDALSANKETSQEFRELVGEVEQGVKELETKGFIQATVDPIAATTGVDPKVVVLFSSIFFAVLLEMGSSWGFWLIARARAEHVEPGAPAPLAIVPEVSPPAAPAPVMALGFGGTPVPIAPAAPAVHLSQGQIEPPKPKRETKVVLKDEPKIEHDRENVVDADDERVLRAMTAVLAHAPGERVLLSTLGVRLNEVLPPKHQLRNQYAISTTVTKHIHKAIPGAQKARIAGQMWITDVRLREPSESVSISRSKV